MVSEIDGMAMALGSDRTCFDKIAKDIDALIITKKIWDGKLKVCL